MARFGFAALTLVKGPELRPIAVNLTYPPYWNERKKAAMDNAIHIRLALPERPQPEVSVARCPERKDPRLIVIKFDQFPSKAIGQATVT